MVENKKIRVLHIITRLDKGGSAENTLFTVAHLGSEKAFLLSGETYDPQGTIRGFIKERGINWVIIPELIREIDVFKDIQAFWKLYRYIKRNKFDIVHTHSSKAGMLGRWAAKLAGVKIIVHTPHGHIFYGYFNWFKTKIFIYLEKITSLITDRIITLTQRGKEEHIKYRIAKPNKFIPIYSGIEIEKFTNFQLNIIKEKERLNISLEAPVIGTVSRLESVKGNRYFIASLPDIVKTFPCLKVIFVGDGSERKKLEEDVKNLGLSENVIFIEECKDIRRIVSTFDILVLSSLNEGMGRCLLEAQILGVPVVATEVGGIPDIVRDGITGILVPPRNPEAMSEAIVKLLKDKFLRKNMSKEGKRWVDKKFIAEAMVEKISDLYQGLIRENNRNVT